jgi:membrane associated rhomboid family serine protease
MRAIAHIFYSHSAGGSTARQAARAGLIGGGPVAATARVPAAPGPRGTLAPMRDPKVLDLPLSIPVLLIASVVIVSVIGFIAAPVRRALILNPYRVRYRLEVHRLFTAGWVHSGLSHLFFNMFTLFFFADQALSVLGPEKFLALYVSAVIVSFVPTVLRHMNDPQYNSLGASGAVAAVMFSAILLHPKLKLYVFFIPYPVPGIVFALGYLGYSLWQSQRATDGVNHGAHFAGAVYGAVLTWLFEPARVEKTIRSFF